MQRFPLDWEGRFAKVLGERLARNRSYVQSKGGRKVRKKSVRTYICVLAATIAVSFPLWCWAYEKVSSSGCLDCHQLGEFGADDGSIHGSHSNCADCHEGVPQADQVFSSSCLVCHPQSSSETCDLVTFHGGSCTDCHSDCGSSTTTTTAPRTNIKGNRYEVLFVGEFKEGCNSATVDFRSDNVMVLDCMDGYGTYVSFGNVFTAVYWTNNYFLGDGLAMVISGAAVYPYIYGGGLTYYGKYVSIVLLSGYIL